MMGNDVIRIKDLEVYAYHGVMEEEKAKGQFFYISVDMRCDVSKAGRTDDLTQTVNYAAVCDDIVSFMTENRFDLIESCAERLARMILRKYEMIESIDLTVRKPQAPIAHPFGDVSVTVSRSRHTAFIALGSNMGDKKAFLDGAVAGLDEDPDTKVIKVSSFIETKPYGGVEQDDFLNGAVMAETLLDPFELLDLCHDIENAADRKREIRWGPRTLDVDILLYDDLVMDTPDLIIPHADMANRDFVLGPLSEIAPAKRHPLTGMTVSEMLARLSVR
ncbi:MAG: 2-amino-4-hydroxy-6-hydroxymethyldihydropteridine diphosphokinase [Firmicutes bacterium]|nr:2-amino-4-hydroxy-6-hydroxymethyldihydropteridine diphosphokinase [Bacillota bacterium]